MIIKEMCDREKPRERLIRYGSSFLSNEELLAIILRTGTKNKSSKELASIILKEYKSINNLKDATVNKLNKIKGMGNAKSTQVIAALELGRRVYYVKDKICTKVKNTNEIYSMFRSEFDDIRYERFIALYLDVKNKVITFLELFKGTLNESTVHPREIFKEALKLSAAYIIVMHNHPSGDPTPSAPDIEFTTRLFSIGKTMGIPIIDHVIFGNNKFYSFYESMHKK